jgi:hypothetical protein
VRMIRGALLAISAIVAISGAVAEEAKVASGITVSSYIKSATGNNNIEYSRALTNAFTTNGTNSVTVHHTAHGKIGGQKFSIADGATVDGLDMNGAWTIATVPNVDSLTFTHTGTASGSTATTGSANITYSDHTQDGKLRFICNMSHMGYDDPIKYPGQPGLAHLHTFFGNTTTNAYSTYTILRQNGDGTCPGGPINRTAYWFPSLITQAGTKAKYPLNMQWYYVDERRDLIEYTSPVCAGAGLLQDGRAAACPVLPAKKLQRGQKIIYGYDPGISAEPTTYASSILFAPFKCMDGAGNVYGSVYKYLHHRSNSSLGLTSNSSCPTDGYFQIRVTSPACWNGDLDHADHYSHFATAGQDGSGNLVCPATHPYRHLSFEVLLTFSYSGSISTVADWYFSSDRHNGADHEAGTTWHWDMFFAWEDGAGQDVLAFFATNIHGMHPDPEAGYPYTFGTEGGGGNAAQDWVGSKYMRNFDSGGLSQAPFTDCTVLGVAYASCQLKTVAEIGTTVQSNTEIDIPSVPIAGRGMRGKKAKGKFR